jgi:hypothetical protein
MPGDLGHEYKPKVPLNTLLLLICNAGLATGHSPLVRVARMHYVTTTRPVDA